MCSLDNDTQYIIDIQWYPELSRFCPDVPIVLVGTKLDLREDKEHVLCNSQQPVSMEMGLTMQGKNTNVVKYMECSALTNYGVKEVFIEAIMAGVKYQNKRPSRNNRKCCIL